MPALKTLLLASAATLVAGAVSAADLARPVVVPPPPAVFTWDGPYLGVHAGYLWGDVNVDLEGGFGGAVNGVIGGLLGGINFQHGGFVFGAEADFGLTNASGSGPTQDVEDIEDLFHYDANWNAHFRVRGGVPVGRALFFIAGGLALADLDISYEQLVSGGTFVGWTAGIGVDYAFTDKVIGRLELLYDDYGSKSYSGQEPFTASFTATTLRAAAIFKFGGPH